MKGKIMQSLTVLRSAAIASLIAAAGIGSATAADIVRVPPQYIPPPPPPPLMETSGGFYLRGDIGGGMYNADKIELQPKLVNEAWGYYSCGGPCGTLVYNPGVKNSKTLSNSIDTAIFAGLGAGYQVNSWLRGDATFEYRLPTEFKIKEQTTYSTSAGTYGTGTNDTTGKLSAMVAMINGYVDLGTWSKITPYLGAGVGLASLNVHDVKDVDSGTPNTTNAGKNKKTNGLAWALHAGVAYEVSPSMKLELGYRYINLGDKIESGDVSCNGCAKPFKTSISALTSHDVKAGLRWNFNDAPCCGTAPPPMAYPAPVYSPPPLARRY